VSLSNSRRNTSKSVPGYTDADRIRIKREAAARYLTEECDGDTRRADWIRYKARHGLTDPYQPRHAGVEDQCHPS